MLDRAPLSPRTSVQVAVITFLVLTAISVGVQFTLPKTYVAVTRIEVTQRNQPQTTDPYFVQTEFERIKSDAVLVAAVEALRRTPDAANFGKAWHAQTNDLARARMLRNRIDLRQSNNTGLIELRFSDRSPKQAALIADAISWAYRENAQQSKGPVAVQIIDVAEPPTRPVSPNIPLLLALATVLNAILSTLAGIFASNLFR